MAIDLFNRRAILQVDTPQIPAGVGAFDISFEVNKNAGRGLSGWKPSTAQIRVWNLSADTRAKLSAIWPKQIPPKKSKIIPRGRFVQLEAGYGDHLSRIFRGDLRLGYHERQGADVVTYLEAGDGEALARAKIFKSWAPGTPVSTVLRDVADSLGIGLGNLTAEVVAPVLTNYGPVFTQGTAVAGKAVKELNRITKSIGVTWSIQDGTLQFLGAGTSLRGTAIKMSEDSGMLDAPNLDQNGFLKVKCLMIPDLFPGRRISLDSEQFHGFYVVDKAKYSGDTFGANWEIELECERL